MKCPCCSGLLYNQCCQPILDGHPAPTAEALVRSRYSAFAMKILDHVEKTHAPEVRDDFNRAEAERLADECEWQSLRIEKVQESGDHAEVDFVMRVRRDETTATRAVSSRFRREGGQWLFVSSKPIPFMDRKDPMKTGRNDPCPCGSAKKYKKCCGALVVAE